jgi:aminobenzoyl-glutamate utilization protein B
VVQPRADVLYLIRAPRLPDVEEIYRRINKIAQGAALMTETEVEIEFSKACANVVRNITLCQILYDNFRETKLPEYTAEERAFADAIRADSTKPSGSELRMFLCGGPEREELTKRLEDRSLCDFLIPWDHQMPDLTVPASSDVGDVSWNVPTAQVVASCYALGTPEHSWQLVSQGRTSLAHKGLLTAAKVIACACVDVFEHPEIAVKARTELDKRLGGHPYRSPIPAEVKPQAISSL